ncbi:Cu,Zn superoxide dismutase-like protein [Gonapodya prolifera JEL478]|uniref:Cu,Zn superoxide dismutase-like protein n=1 Tax=Gonapodya prolifera (strain JEL478) TaxID=1344416 RepID=A0A139AS34_GONPJ|nr:Cu,Zn superoxide dismutase-like protein [Gonapodya prolifera JEL478]|eukprot:KXS19519.1 Cu,Zn superoxide dismutase-like protein [Gonapodya prolifera JEL478]
MATQLLSKPLPLEFGVELKCQNCVNSVQAALQSELSAKHIVDLTFSIPDQRVTLSSSLPPSRLVQLIRSSGRSAVLRGSGGVPGSPTFLGAAVCIFEIFKGARGWAQHNNRGLARLMQVDDTTCAIDVSLDGFPASTVLEVRVHESGDISGGASTTGEPIHILGAVTTDEDGRADLVAEVGSFSVWDVIGRSLVVADKVAEESGRAAPEDAVCGVIARSAGLFENTKKVCSCSGMTLWEESREPKI